MKRITTLVFAILLAVSLPSGVTASSDLEITGFEELVKAKGSFLETWVRPGADFARYTKIYPVAAIYQFAEDRGQPIPRTGTIVNRPKHDATMFSQPEFRERFKSVVSNGLLAELERKGLTQVGEAGPETLMLRAAILDVTTNVPANTVRALDVGLVDIGEARIIFDLIDSETGVVQARLGETRYIQSWRGNGNAETVWAEVDRWARQVAFDLHRTVKKFADG